MNGDRRLDARQLYKAQVTGSTVKMLLEAEICSGGWTTGCYGKQRGTRMAQRLKGAVEK